MYEEARYFQLAPLQAELERWKTQRECESEHLQCKCVVFHIASKLGERVSMTAPRPVMEELFPELTELIATSLRSDWNQDTTYIIRFPLSGHCHLNSVQVKNTTCKAFNTEQGLQSSH